MVVVVMRVTRLKATEAKHPGLLAHCAGSPTIVRR